MSANTNTYSNVGGLYPNDFSQYQQIGIGQIQLEQAQQQKWQQFEALIRQEQQKMPDGTKPVVICAGVVEEAKDLDAAQQLAENRAHQKSADAYILKPIKRVSPKRDVVTTEL